MRMLVPSLPYRREIDRNLVAYFRSHRPSAFRRAISGLCRFYGLKMPRIEWFEYLDWGKTAGKTYEDGRIHLVHPENWKRGRIYNRERQWVQTVYHEMGHYLLWADAERKAEAFAYRMLSGLRRGARRRSEPASRGAANRRKGVSRLAPERELARGARMRRTGRRPRPRILAAQGRLRRSGRRIARLNSSR